MLKMTLIVVFVFVFVFVNNGIGHEALVVLDEVGNALNGALLIDGE